MSLVCEVEGEETRFTRSISTAGVGEYRVNGKAVRADAYSDKLKTFGILTKAHTGFLVFQGYVSELAAKSPKELCAVFEQISGAAPPTRPFVCTLVLHLSTLPTAHLMV